MASPTAYAVPPLLAQVHLAFTQALETFAATQIGAFVLGRESQYDAMHAPPPVIPRSDRSAHLTPGRMRATLALHHEHVAPVHGIAVAGPPMPQRPTAEQVRAMLQVTAQGSSSQPQAVRGRALPMPGIPGMPYALRRMPIVPRTMMRAQTMMTPPTRRKRLLQTASVQSGSTSTTGINRYWEYEEGAVPGVGKYMVNVAYGTLLLQSDDVDVHERGIDLAIRRTWNGQMYVQRDWNSAGTSDDGSPTPGMWGQGFTSNLDTHLALNSNGGITVWDIDGARYDFGMPAKNSCLVGAPGVYLKLCDDGGYGYFLWKKSGTVYHYYTPTASALPAGDDALAGRLYMVSARNENNWIRLDYAWSVPDASNSQNLRTITVTHADGQALILNFAPNPNNTNATLLMSVQRPGDSAPTIFYTYDQYNDLQTVTLPGNGNGRDGTPNNTTYDYGYVAPGQISWVASPRYSANTLAGTEGGYLNFIYDSSNQVVDIYHEGIANFTPGDNTTGEPIQPGTTGNQNIRSDFFEYGSNETQLTDSDGHAANWFYDTSGRVTEAQDWTGAPNNLWLTTKTTWDSNNNIAEAVDVRGNPTDYGYDGFGNTLWVQGPQVTTSLGAGRPVTRYAYDQYNNVVAYCDAQRQWTTGATNCAPGPGITYYTWNYGDGNEPYGRLSDTYTPLGYHLTIGYDSSREDGDNGLPTSVTGDQITQNDGSTITPSQQFVYDQFGNLVCYSKLAENTGAYDWWRL